MMSGLGLFVAAILAFLIIYANAFLIRRRKKEFGLYILLGMRPRRISAILVCETLLVGLLSLLAGLVVGVIGSQVMALLTAKLLAVSIARFAFVFSWPALVRSCCYFGVAFLIVIVFNVVTLNRQKLLDLLYADKKNARLVELPLRVSVAVFLVCLGLIGLSYYLLLAPGVAVLADRDQMGLAVLLALVGTFGLFFSLSGFFLKLVSGRKNIYFTNLNMFTLKQLSSRIHTAWVSMSFVALMLTGAISAVAVGTSLAAAVRGYDPREIPASVAVAYVAFYIGLIFLIACASVLAIAQLSEAADNQTRYGLLAKLGASRAQLGGSLLRQVGLYFLAPLVVAVVHAGIIITAMSELIRAIGDLNVALVSLAAGGLVLLVYGGYFCATYVTGKRTALPV
jgi:putative ABC transport system permease protein